MTAPRGLRGAFALSALLLGFVIAGCSSGGGVRMYVHPASDMSFYTKVAVVPFGNLSSERFAGERVGRAFITELNINGRLPLVEDGDFRKALDKAGAAADVQGAFETDKVKVAAAAVGANAIIRGTVTDYQMQPFGSSVSPVVGFDVEMIDVASGTTVWRASITRRGKGRVPIVGSGTQSFGALVQDCCEEVVSKLEKEAF
jgi:hypothetical protein